MKKTVIFLLVTLLLVSGCSSFTFTESVKGTIINKTNSTVEVHKLNHFFKEYIPLRETFEGLGYDVMWRDDTRMVEIIKDNESVYVKEGEKYFLRNGVLINGIEEPIIRDKRMYISQSTIQLMFESVKETKSNTFEIKDGLIRNRELPTLNSKEEYDVLMSFYPSPELVYMDTNGGFDLKLGFADDFVLESPEEVTMETAATESSVSETNNQVDGVDEADIVKITDDYIFALRNNELQIIKTGRGELNVVHTISENGFYPQQMFVNEDKLVLIGSEQNTEIKTYEEDDRILTVPVYRSETLMVKCYNISDLKNKSPQLIKSFGVEGYYLSARMIDDYVYVVANRYTYYNDPIRPMILEGDASNSITSKEIGYDDMSYFPGHVNNSMLYTLGLDLNNLTIEGLDIDTYVGGGDSIYADRDSLYIALNGNSGMWWSNWNETTDIFSFDLTKGKIDFKASGTVPGYILNQFSMDEYNNHFRITTTRWGSEDVTKGNTTLNNLYILNDELDTIGSVENLAPGETIYSTRMMGEKVYMVTYRQVDPFYVIDTSIPSEPKVLGYLKIPGYSSYLHPYDETTIIGVGMETVMKGDRVVNDGVKISLFDVSDFSNPIEKDKVILGKGGSSTDIGYDHKAFLFNKEKNILAIPVRLVNGEDWNDSKDAYVFNFTSEGMLNFRGAISHRALEKHNDYYYDYDNSVSRIMYDGDDLYTLSNNWLKLNDFDSLESVDSLRR